MKGYKCGSRSTLTGGLSLWCELGSTKIDSCRATVLRLHVGGHVPQQLLTAGQCERAWSAACIVPSALYRHIEYGHRDREDGIPVNRSGRRGASPSGPRATAASNGGVRAMSFDQERQGSPRSRVGAWRIRPIRPLTVSPRASRSRQSAADHWKSAQRFALPKK